MTEDEACGIVADSVSRETFETLTRFVALVIEGARAQNLVSASTFETIWTRHVLDSVQLTRLVPSADGSWIDVGSGAGFPGIVTAIVTGAPTILIESRRLRTTFLTEAAKTLGLADVQVITASVAQVTLPPAAILTARAVAPLPKLFAAMHHLAGDETVWLLPKGRSAASELADARRTWHGAFTMQASITDPEASIIVARNVTPRGRTARR